MVAEPDDRWADLRVEEEPRALRWPSLPAFVAHLADVYRRDVTGNNGRIWCPDWWKHPEAVVRLEAMWRALEALRLDPSLGVSVWLRDHADHHLRELMDPDGPFRGCHAVRGHAADPVEPLPINDPPEGWWADGDAGL